MEKFEIKVYNPHWTQIRFLSLLGYSFFEKNMEDKYYIVECEEPLISNLKNLKEKCEWISAITPYEPFENKIFRIETINGTPQYLQFNFIVNTDGTELSSSKSEDSESEEQNWIK